MWTSIVEYVAVVLIGGFVGVGELISRYKDEPFRAVANRHAFVYIAINAVASAVALLAINHINITTDYEVNEISQVLLAGFGSMSVFRSAAFVVRVHDQDISIGPNALLTVILSAIDRAVDRERAKVRAAQVAATMRSFSFAQSGESLAMLAFSMMQNLTSEDRDAFQKDLEHLKNKVNIDDATKSMCLGLHLMDIVGTGVLEAAVTAMKQAAKAGADHGLVPPPPAPPQANEVEA